MDRWNEENSEPNRQRKAKYRVIRYRNMRIAQSDCFLVLGVCDQRMNTKTGPGRKSAMTNQCGKPCVLRSDIPLWAYSSLAASLAKYVTMKSAPARRMPRSDSSIARSRSSQPFSNAACSIEYSPETW